ncbi:MAG: putative auto-transporter adhesin, head domain [Mucilaginibacter sp.]|nr:putative auto-transporter adhesin, head domain [Mucilaginibacter sp.]
MIEVKGSGNIVSAVKSISSFIRLHISINGTIELIQADEEKVIVEADDNLQEYIEVTNSGRTLYVTAEGKWRTPGFSRLNVKVYYRQLFNIYNASTNGTLVCANPLRSSEPVEVKIYSDKSSSKLNINAPAVKLITACVGDVEIEGSCNVLEINAKSEGSLYARGMLAKNVSLKNYSVGNLDVYADETLAISNYGEGNISYWGDGVLKDIKQYGDGEVKHRKD